MISRTSADILSRHGEDQAEIARAIGVIRDQLERHLSEKHGMNGNGTVQGGDRATADKLARYPLLVSVGGVIKTEDGKLEISLVPPGTVSTPATARELAAKHGTTPEHARQAIDYATWEL